MDRMDKLDARSIKAIVSALIAILTYSLSGGTIDPIYAIVGGVAAMTLMSIHEIVDAVSRILNVTESSDALLHDVKEELALMKKSQEAIIEAIRQNQTAVHALTSDVKEQEMRLLSPAELERVLTEKLSNLSVKEEPKHTEEKKEAAPKTPNKSKFDFGTLKGSAKK